MSRFDLDDVYTLEEDENVSVEDESMALQRAINSGDAWSFQGSYGRAMMDAIEAGRCMLGKSGARDYWGNYIPSRDEVKAGTKGSFEYVVEARGQHWAEMMKGA